MGEAAADLVDYCIAVQADQITGFWSIAAVAFATWDLLLTLSDEVELIWRIPGILLKSLYVCIRYVPLFGGIALFTYYSDSDRELRLTITECAFSTLAEAIFLGCVIVIVEVILLIRVHALYNRSRPVLLGLLGGFAMNICATAFGVLYSMKGFDYKVECLSSTPPRIILLVWLV
ncbi:hypothetical protein GY45DRAFT_1315510 [Cubamyces sp. BRFM 1775]|nr:hypothetical protein GY45DRAFT_1315510 [Cubamyces sp. BRFM 1775]